MYTARTYPLMHKINVQKKQIIIWQKSQIKYKFRVKFQRLVVI